ncbi:MAG: hypothetical protein HWD58_02485 [Bacteroidota bacterium]|nr:MAG: hypothetical protein HWD58_02485 [Bacteroidota bacterium]
MVLQGRNAIQTWSANPVLMDCNTTYNFTTALTQAFDQTKPMFPVQAFLPFIMVM